MELLERASLLENLSGFLQEASLRHGLLVLLAGEAGVGKTVFIQHFNQQVRDRAQVLVGLCDPLSTPKPLAPLLDIAPAFHELMQLIQAENRDQVFHSLLSALQLRSKPTVVVFEDVHWADEATLDLLRFLGRRLDTTRTLLIVTYRDDEVGLRHPLRIMMGDLATSGVVRRLSLAPLSIAAVALLAKETALDPSELHQRTRGNPFFVTEVLATGDQGIPGTVRDAVLARVARLAPEGREALEIAAVIGARSEPQLFQALGVEREAVEACVDAGMLLWQGESFTFRHELAREAVYASLSPQRKVELHQRVLAVLRSTHEDMARLAHHAEAANDKEAVLEYAPVAARKAAEFGAHREAAEQYERALRFAHGLIAEEHAPLLEAWSYECYLTDQIPKAIEGRQKALERWREVKQPLKEGENLRWLSRLAWFLGQRAEAERTAQAALWVLEALPPGPELAMAYSNLSQLKMLAHENDEAVLWGDKAITLAEQLGDMVALVHALNNVGTAKLRMGNEAGRTELERSLRLAIQHKLEEHAARAWTNLASCAVSAYNFALADGYLHEGIAYCTEHDLDSWRLYMSGWRALSFFYQGDWGRAAEEATRVCRHPNVSPVSAIQALVVLGRVRARRGDPEALLVLDEALALALETNELQRLGPVYCARAEAAHLTGDIKQVLGAANATYALAITRKESWLVTEMAYWRWRAGDWNELPDAANPFVLEMAGDWQGAAREWQALACPYEAARALTAGDEAALRQALEVFEALGARPAAATARERLRELGVSVPRGPRATTLANPAGLTKRELRVLELLAEGKSNGDIARVMVRSSKTVAHHVSAILAKLEVQNRMEAVRKATALGILGLNRET